MLILHIVYHVLMQLKLLLALKCRNVLKEIKSTCKKGCRVRTKICLTYLRKNFVSDEVLITGLKS